MTTQQTTTQNKGDKKMEKVHGTDLNLADIVDMEFSGYGTATVQKITDTEIELFRPFVHTGNFEHTGGVSCYVGIETFKASKDSMFIRVMEGPKLR